MKKFLKGYRTIIIAILVMAQPHVIQIIGKVFDVEGWNMGYEEIVIEVVSFIFGVALLIVRGDTNTKIGKKE